MTIFGTKKFKLLQIFSFLFLLMALCGLPALAANPVTKKVTAEYIYTVAKERNIRNLLRYRSLLELKNKKGWTATCLALEDADWGSYQMLVRAGAKPRPECLKYVTPKCKDGLCLKISKDSSGTGLAFLSGAAVAGGAALVAMALDDDDSGSKRSSSKCEHGVFSEGKCICLQGWKGDKCETQNECGNEFVPVISHCPAGQHKTTQKCYAGDVEKVECVANVENKNCATYVEDEDKCASCSSPNYLNNGQCVSNPVDNCADKSTTAPECKTCDTGFYLQDGQCVADTVAHCGEYVTNEDKCETCESEGYILTATGQCVPVACVGYKESCATDEYSVAGDTCLSGDRTLLKCEPYSQMSNCLEKDPNNDKCLTCNEGWSGDKCETPNECGSEFVSTTSHCPTGQHKTTRKCYAGDAEKVECVDNVENTNCTTYVEDEDKCASCSSPNYLNNGQCVSNPVDNCADKSTTAPECKTCDTGFYLRNGQCVANTVTHCDEYVTNEDKCATCESEGYTLNASGQCLPAACEGYKGSCTANEYSVSGDTCLSGESTLLKCVPYSANHCATYSANEDKCASCHEGWEGDLCNTAVTCSPEYKGSCTSDEYKTESDTCKSGDSTLYRCTAYSDNHCKTFDRNNNECASCQEGWEGELCNTTSTCSTEYKETCAENEYKTVSDTCKSGNNTLYKCTLRSSNHCDTYNPNKDECLRCKEGWTDALCNTAATCSAGYKEACEDNEYKTASDTCKSGDNTLYKCTAYSTNHCETYNPDKNQCLSCQEGWTGTTTLCNTAVACGAGYKETCATNEYMTETDTCLSGGKTLYKCTLRSSNNCETYSANEDKCTSCQMGWEGDLCNTATTCDGYKQSCTAGEYSITGDTCLSGGNTLVKCATYSTNHCDTYNPNKDECLTCQTGWTDTTTLCNTTATCGAGYKESCTANKEYQVANDTCPSGDKTLVKCTSYSSNHCDTYALDKNECLSCQDGWTGETTLCNTTATCGAGYKTTCASNEYKTESDTCKAGNQTLYKCTPYAVAENCATYSTTSDACLTCKANYDLQDGTCVAHDCGDDYSTEVCVSGVSYQAGTCMSGSTTMYKCADYSENNCAEYNPNKNECSKCQTGWTDTTTLCNTASACGVGYKESCSADEYQVAGDTCPNGDKILVKCTSYSGNHCDTYNPNKNECLTCKAGWEGDLCNTAATCDGYKQSCTADEYSVAGDTCLSGDNTLVKCATYSGNHCATHNPNKNECLSCQEGWTDETTLCNTTATCDAGYKTTCASKEYKTESDTCKAGNQTLYKCTPYAVAENCATYSATSDACLTCKANYDKSGNTCVAHDCGSTFTSDACDNGYYASGECKSGENILHQCLPNVCDGYKESCDVDEFTVSEDTCQQGEKTLVKCSVYSDMPNCLEKDTEGDKCKTCKEGWKGEQCTTKEECATGYKKTCASNEYKTASDTCKSGDDTLYMCTAYSTNHCKTFDANKNECATCQDGWTGETTLCNTTATCGAGYKTTCASNEYKTESDTCKAGNQTLYKCTPYSVAENCATYSSTSDACLTCKANYDKSGNTCVAHDCGDDYSAETCVSGTSYQVGGVCMSGTTAMYKCVDYSENHCLTFNASKNECLRCRDGWTGITTLCNTTVTCGTGYKESCTENEEYQVPGDTCPSGDKTLVKCTSYSNNNCATFASDRNECLSCKNGWTGETTLCTTVATCGTDYKEICASDEYRTASAPCQSGGKTLYQCAKYTVQNCATYSTTSDACSTCKTNYDKSGNTCVAHDCGAEYSTDKCVLGTSYQAGTCMSGTTTMYKCVNYSVNHCLTFNASKNECLTCQTGWTDTTTLCNTASACGTGYKESCATTEYKTESDTCVSGDKTLVKCTSYSSNHCATHNPNKNECLSCQEGWTGETTLCNTTATCDAGYKTTCASNEYKTESDTCKAGNQTLYKCTPYTVQNCATYSATSDACLTCKANYDKSGNTCVAHDCGNDYSTSPCIIETSYQAGICISGMQIMYKCNERTQIVEHCVEYNKNSEGCARCVEGLRLYGGRCVIDGQNEEFIDPEDIRSGEGRVLPSTDIYGSGILGENKPDVEQVESETNVQIVHNDDGDKHTVNGIFAENGDLVVKHDVEISNEGDGDVYGARALNGNVTLGDGSIYIDYNGGGNVYGLQGQNIGNNNTITIDAHTSSDAKVYGMCAINNALNTGDIDIGMNGNGTAYGMYSKQGNLRNNNLVHIDNFSTGNAYGMYVESVRSHYAENTGKIEISNYSSGTAVGLRHGVNNEGSALSIENTGSGNAYGILDGGSNAGTIDINSNSDEYVEIAGMYNRDIQSVGSHNLGTIYVEGRTGDVYGIRNDVSQSDIYNQGRIEVYNQIGSAYGIMSANNNIVNNTTGSIKVHGDGNKAVGIESLATDQNDTGTITNYGYLDAHGYAKEIYGIKGNSVNEGTVFIQAETTTTQGRAYGMSGESLENKGSIDVYNDGLGLVGGMETGVNNGSIAVENNDVGSAHGMGSGVNNSIITVTNKRAGVAYGSSSSNAINAERGVIRVTNEGESIAGGMNGGQNHGHIYATNKSDTGIVVGMSSAESENRGTVTVTNEGAGEAIGLRLGAVNTEDGHIIVTNKGAGTASGINDTSGADNFGEIEIYNEQNGKVYGLRGRSNSGVVSIHNQGSGFGYGMDTGVNNGSISIENNGTGYVYGIINGGNLKDIVFSHTGSGRSNGMVRGYNSGNILINHTGSGTVIGSLDNNVNTGNITITSNSKGGNIYGQNGAVNGVNGTINITHTTASRYSNAALDIYGQVNGENAGTINIETSGDSGGTIVVGQYEGENTGSILVKNTGTVKNIIGKTLASNGSNNGLVKIEHSGGTSDLSMAVKGLYLGGSTGTATNKVKGTNNGVVTVLNDSLNDAFGFISYHGDTEIINGESGVINMSALGNGSIYGMYTRNYTATNKLVETVLRNNGQINMIGYNGTGNVAIPHIYGMFSAGNSEIYNTGEISISAYRSYGYAMTSNATSTIINSGNITVNNIQNGFVGILSQSSGDNVKNQGQINMAASDGVVEGMAATDGDLLNDVDGIIRIATTADNLRLNTDGSNGYAVAMRGKVLQNSGVINLYANSGVSTAYALDAGYANTLTEDYIASNVGTILIDHKTVNVAGTDVESTGSRGYYGVGLRGYVVGNYGNLTINRIGTITGLIASVFAENTGGTIKVDNSGFAYGINVEGVSSRNATFGRENLDGGIAVNDGTIELANVSGTAVGVKSTYGDVYNAKSNARASITINNSGSSSINPEAYGVWTEDGLSAYNTFAKTNANIEGNITIRSTNGDGYAKVYGVVSDNAVGNAYNVYKNSQSTMNSNASGSIVIRNKGGKLYGVSAPSYAYNALIESNIYSQSTAQGEININQMLGEAEDVYGVYASSDRSGRAVNAQADGYGVSAVGKININSLVQPTDINHKIYGVRGYSAYNSLTNGSTTASGTITIDATTGDVYGVNGVFAYGGVAVSDATSLSNIDLTAVNSAESYGNNANLYGVYGTFIAANVFKGGNGAINLTNNGSGIARGVYSANDAYNVYSDYVLPEAIGTIIGTNASISGDLVGVMAAQFAANLYVDGSSSYDRNAEIELTNNSSSAAYGVYSTLGNAVNIKRVDGDTSATASIKITKNSTGNAYGVKGADYAINSLVEDSVGAQGKVTIINNASSGSAYGLYADGKAVNAYSISSNGTLYLNPTATQGIIDIQNKSSGIVYGLYGDEVYGAWRGGVSANASLFSTITATNDSTGGVYGMRGNSLAVNAYSTGQRSASGVININNNGNGVVYGMYGNSSSRVINAYSAANSSAAHSSNKTSGSIVIQNNGRGYAYGMYGYDAIGATQDYWGTTAVSTINITNNSSYSVMGIYGNHFAINAYNTLATSETSDVSTIKIVNNSSGIAYGLYSYGSDKTINAYATSTNLNNSAYYTNAEINIENKGSGSAHGVYGKEAIGAMRSNDGSKATSRVNSTIKMTNTGGTAYGIRGSNLAANAVSYRGPAVSSTIDIENKGNGTVYGMYGSNKVVNAYSTAPNTSLYVMTGTYASGTINIKNNGNGTVYGMYGAPGAQVMSTQHIDQGLSAIPKSEINITNNKLGTAFGMYGPSLQNYSSDSVITIDNPTVNGLGTPAGTVVGMYSTAHASNSGTITIRSDGDAVGMYAASGSASNGGTINIGQYTLNSVASPAHKFYGMYAASGASITNSTNGIINVVGTSKVNIGMYGEDGSTIINNGEIVVLNSGTLPQYGIYTQGLKSSVTNTGTISVKGNTCTGDGCFVGYSINAYPIYLGGGTLYQLGNLTSTQALSLDSYNGEVVASKESKFKSDEAISGNVAMSSETVMDGFDTVYAVDDIFEAPDTSDLTVSSKSALFDAKLSEDNSDVVMEMKDFDEVVDNASVASFLSDNYEKENNEQLFNTLKAAETTKSLNKNLNEITGQDMFSRFAYEDLTMMRETNYDLNQKLFNNTEEYFSQAGSVSPFAIGEGSASSRYSLTGMRKGNNTIGLSIALADVNTDDGNKHNRRNDHTYTMAMPMGYKSHGFNIITTPTVGYANGTYDRMGLDGVNYDGKVEKQMFGLMNEARYPFEFAGWNFETALEFNLIGYMIEGSEDARDYALNISRQGNYSVEAGFGIYARKEMHPTRKSTLAFNGGVGFYHEFADPYKMRVSMRGMDGSFLIRDEKRGADRAVVRTGFDYSYDNISIYGTLNSYIDRELRTNADLNFKYNF